MHSLPDFNRDQRKVFSAIYGQPGVCLSDIAEMLGQDRGQVTRVVYGLEKLGLIETTRLPLAAEAGCPPINLRICRPASWTLH